MEAIIVHGPQGSGKTRNAEAIRTALVLNGIVDPWVPGDAVLPGHLHLTNVNPSEDFRPGTAMSLEAAMHKVRARN